MYVCGMYDYCSEDLLEAVAGLHPARSLVGEERDRRREGGGNEVEGIQTQLCLP